MFLNLRSQGQILINALYAIGQGKNFSIKTLTAVADLPMCLRDTPFPS